MQLEFALPTCRSEFISPANVLAFFFFCLGCGCIASLTAASVTQAPDAETVLETCLASNLSKFRFRLSSPGNAKLKSSQALTREVKAMRLVFGRLLILSMYSFIIPTYTNDGYGGQ